MTAQNKLWWEVVFTFLKPATILQKCLRDLQVLPLLLKDDHSLLWTIPEKSLIEIVKWGTENTAAFPRLTGFGQSRRICSHRVAPLSKSACWLFLAQLWLVVCRHASCQTRNQTKQRKAHRQKWRILLQNMQTKETNVVSEFCQRFGLRRLVMIITNELNCLQKKGLIFYHWASPRFKYGMKLFKDLWIIHQI